MWFSMNREDVFCHPSDRPWPLPSVPGGGARTLAGVHARGTQVLSPQVSPGFTAARGARQGRRATRRCRREGIGSFSNAADARLPSGVRVHTPAFGSQGALSWKVPPSLQSIPHPVLVHVVSMLRCSLWPSRKARAHRAGAEFPPDSPGNTCGLAGQEGCRRLRTGVQASAVHSQRL